jgi:hypothetical protein
MLKTSPGPAMIDEILAVGPYSLVVCKIKGNPACGKFSLCYQDPSHMGDSQYLWKDGEFRNYTSTQINPLGGWFDTMEDVLVTLEEVYPGVGEVVSW